MASLINVSAISKTFGISPLFENITLNIAEGDRLGLIGPNGAGKSTLLEILTGLREPDTGNVALRKGTRLAYVKQDSPFPEGLTVRQVVEAAMAEDGAKGSRWRRRWCNRRTSSCWTSPPIAWIWPGSPGSKKC